MSYNLSAILDFSKILFSAKLQQLFLKLVETIYLQTQKWIYLRIEGKNEIRIYFVKKLQFSHLTREAF